MVAYSFQKRFVDYVQAGLEPGPWCPGMKRHTLRQPRAARSQHARPEQPVHLYTAMRTKHCRMIGKAVCRVQIPLRLVVGETLFTLCRRDGAAPRSHVARLAPIVRELLVRRPGLCLDVLQMAEFARTDGFRSTAEMRQFFELPEITSDEDPVGLDLVLIGWSPAEAD